MKKKIAFAFICLSVVVGFQNCNNKGLISAYGTISGSSQAGSSQAGSEAITAEDQLADQQSNVSAVSNPSLPILNTQEVVASLDKAQPGESCDSWLERNGVTAAVKSAYHIYDGVESKWGQGGVNENKACAIMIYSTFNKAWSCTAGSSSHVDQFDPNPANWSYPVVACNDGVRSVRTAFAGFTELPGN